jgi:hypothetical protein
VPEPPGPNPVPGPPQPIFPPPPTIPGSSGLPTYTVPPAAGKQAATPPPSPFGFGGPAPATQPFGPKTPTVQVSPPPAHPVADDPAATMAVPQQRTEQRGPGTVYGTGGYEQIEMTMPVSTNPVENSGSLTGHILAQGWRDEIVDRRRSNLRVAIAMLVVLGLLVTVSLVFLLTAGSDFTDMVKGMFN